MKFVVSQMGGDFDVCAIIPGKVVKYIWTCDSFGEADALSSALNAAMLLSRENNHE